MKISTFVFPVIFILLLISCGGRKSTDSGSGRNGGDNTTIPRTGGPVGDSTLTGDRSSPLLEEESSGLGVPPSPVIGGEDCAAAGSDPEDSSLLPLTLIWVGSVQMTVKDRYIQLSGNTDSSPVITANYACIKDNITCYMLAQQYSRPVRKDSLLCDYRENGKVMRFANNDKEHCQNWLEGRLSVLQDKGYMCSNSN